MWERNRPQPGIRLLVYGATLQAMGPPGQVWHAISLPCSMFPPEMQAECLEGQQLYYLHDRSRTLRLACRNVEGVWALGTTLWRLCISHGLGHPLLLHVMPEKLTLSWLSHCSSMFTSPSFPKENRGCGIGSALPKFISPWSFLSQRRKGPSFFPIVTVSISLSPPTSFFS